MKQETISDQAIPPCPTNKERSVKPVDSFSSRSSRYGVQLLEEEREAQSLLNPFSFTQVSVERLSGFRLKSGCVPKQGMKTPTLIECLLLLCLYGGFAMVGSTVNSIWIGAQE